MIALSGGGTGGHLSIVRALKNALNKRGVEPIYIGSKNGQDLEWFENEEGFSEKFFLDSRGVVNKKGLKKLSSLSEILKSSLACKKIFKKYNVTDIISVGGYSAAPASFATIFSHVNLYIHEQNASIGRLNKILKPFAKEFFSSYDSGSKIKDYPVDISYFEKRKEINELKTIIFLGGSQGANAINELAKNLAKDFLHDKVKIIHQCGKRDLRELRDFYKMSDIEVDLFDFTPNLIDKLKKADFAISRAGASTLWELCALGIPSLFIPYPYASSNHQYYNAKKLHDKGLALLKMQSELDAKTLYSEIKSLDLQNISKNLKNVISPNGAEKILDIVLKK